MVYNVVSRMPAKCQVVQRRSFMIILSQRRGASHNTICLKPVSPCLCVSCVPLVIVKLMG